MSVTTLENIASKMALRKREDEQHKLRYLMFARDGLRELNINVGRDIKSIMLDIEDDMTVLLPPDYVSHLKIGINICGKIVELDEDNRLFVGFEKDDFCDEDGNEVPAETLFLDTCRCIQDCNDFPSYYANAYTWGNVYYRGVNHVFEYVPAHKSIGLYRKKGNKLYFQSICPKNAKVVMEYYSDGLSLTDISYVDSVLEAPILAYIRWQNELEKGGSNMDRYQAEYMRTYTMYKNYKMRGPVGDLYKAVRRQKYQGKIGR